MTTPAWWDSLIGATGGCAGSSTEIRAEGTHGGAGPDLQISGGRSGDRGQALLDLLSHVTAIGQEQGPARSDTHAPRLLEMVAACDRCDKQHTFRGTASAIAAEARSWSQAHQCTAGRR